MPLLEDHIVTCVNQEVYDADIYSKYSKEDIEKANGYIDHNRDFLLHMLVLGRS